MKHSVDKKSSNLTAFEYLSLIDQAARLHTSQVVIPNKSQEGWLGLMFLSGQSVLMCPLDEVTEIATVPKYIQVPKVKPWLIGLSSYRGVALPITDLSGMLTSELSTITKHSRVFVIALQEEYVGLLVNRVLGLQRVNETSSAQALPSGLMAEYTPFVTESIMTEQFQLPIVSCRAIVRHTIFKNVVQKIEEPQNDI